jgi:hypothetical protein
MMVMPVEYARVERIIPLHPIDTTGLAPAIRVSQASYRRLIPAHYQGNLYIRAEITLNIIMAPGGRLVVPAGRGANFIQFYEDLRHDRPALFQQILAPSGAAKASSTDYITPIKEIAQMCLSGCSLPGDEQLYGWDGVAAEGAEKGNALQLSFQGNGLYFNRGSVFYDGIGMHAYPDAFLAEVIEKGASEEMNERLALNVASLKRPLLFFITEKSGQMSVIRHEFLAQETYGQGMQRLTRNFTERQVQSGLAASPPLIVPDEHGEPLYLSLAQMLSQYHANDVRHYLYCPYQGAVLLSAELGRAQSMQPERLSASISGDPDQRVRLHLAETLNFISINELGSILEKKGYAGRFALTKQGAQHFLNLNPLEGVYSHLLFFLTRSGQCGLIQTSGTHGSVTGNDGPTLRQLSAILKDLNTQAPFSDDPMIAAASGAQGNDVANVVCRGKNGMPGLLYHLAKVALLDDNQQPRGTVTTPRVGIGVNH